MTPIASLCDANLVRTGLLALMKNSRSYSADRKSMEQKGYYTERQLELSNKESI